MENLKKAVGEEPMAESDCDDVVCGEPREALIDGQR